MPDCLAPRPLTAIVTAQMARNAVIAYEVMWCVIARVAARIAIAATSPAAFQSRSMRSVRVHCNAASRSPAPITIASDS